MLTAGYPEAVALRLAALCTNRVPADVWTEPRLPLPRRRISGGVRRLYGLPHLPQGAWPPPAPTANLAAYRLDARLAWSRQFHRHRPYTRYADDLAFSGGSIPGKARRTRVVVQVGAIAMEEGFAVNFRKTRVMRQGVRQRVAGVVINAHPNVARDTYDTLEATLHKLAFATVPPPDPRRPP